MSRVETDDLCDCSCHPLMGLSYRECPLCYYSDGNARLIERVLEHGKLVKEFRRGLDDGLGEYNVCD